MASEMKSSIVRDPITISEFRQGDNDQELKDLEAVCEQGSTLMQANVKFYREYTSKHKKYHKWFIYVAHCGSKCVGVVSVGMKEAYVCGTLSWVGWLFDLRVHPEIRRCGLASRLTDQAEQRCREEGGVLMYLTVNSNNKGAQALYDRAGYIQPLKRRPAAWSVYYMRGRDSRCSAVPSDLRITIEEFHNIHQDDVRACVENTSRGFNKTSLTPSREELALIYSSTGHLGSFFAHATDGSAAGLSLWESTDQGMQISRFLFIRRQWLESPIGKLALLLLLLAAVGWCGQWLFAGATTLFWQVVFGCYACGVVAVMWVFFHLYRHTQVHGHALMCRVFAPWYSGSNGLAVLSHLLQHANAVARKAGYFMMLCNLGEAQSEALVFPTAKFTTFVMHKPLVQAASPTPLLDSNFFWDPRDV